MKFKVPISLKQRRRYLLIKTGVSPNKFREELLSSIKRLYGDIGLSNTPVKVIQDEKGVIVRTYHDVISRVLTATYYMAINGISLEIISISGTINKLREKTGNGDDS